MAVATLKFTTYSAINDAMGTKASLKLAHNTYAFKCANEAIEIRYHRNKIAILAPGIIKLTTAGWTTPSTIGRLNQLARANGGGTVGIRDGVAVLIRQGSRKWCRLGKNGVTIDTFTGKPTEYDKSQEHNGWSNWDTWATAATLENISEAVCNALPKLSKSELREMVKSYRSEIGYSSIKNVNVEELYYSFRSED